MDNPHTPNPVATNTPAAADKNTVSTPASLESQTQTDPQTDMPPSARPAPLSQLSGADAPTDFGFEQGQRGAAIDSEIILDQDLPDASEVYAGAKKTVAAVDKTKAAATPATATATTSKTSAKAGVKTATQAAAQTTVDTANTSATNTAQQPVTAAKKLSPQVIKARALLQTLQQNLAAVVKTSEHTLEYVLVSLLCKGHLLLEDAPGLGKTTLARALSQSLSLKLQRLQCTPDLLPSDITGVSIYHPEQHQFQFMPGPVFANVVLADEINRATPRAQSALLEAMAEGRVSVDRKSYQLPQPFMVIATQNPLEYSGTYALPEAQLDRFFMRLSLGYPQQDDEVALMQQQLNSASKGHPLSQIKALLTEKAVLALQAQIEQIDISDAMLGYIAQLVRATREQADIRLGASPRGSLALMHAARALALLRGQMQVTPELVQELLEPVLAHRLLFNDQRFYLAEQRQHLWAQLIARIPVPDYPQSDLS